MKIRTGFVSNSSSSSFIAYGARVSGDDLLTLLTTKIGDDAVIALAEDCTTISEVRDKYSDDIWDNNLSYVFNRANVGVTVDEYPNGDGEYFIGLNMDPEYSLTLNHVLNGIWTPEQLSEIDTFFEGTDIECRLSAGYQYN